MYKNTSGFLLNYHYYTVLCSKSILLEITVLNLRSQFYELRLSNQRTIECGAFTLVLTAGHSQSWICRVPLWGQGGLILVRFFLKSGILQSLMQIQKNYTSLESFEKCGRSYHLTNLFKSNTIYKNNVLIWLQIYYIVTHR